MRKHLFAALTVGTAGILALSACGGGSSDSSSGGSGSDDTVSGKVGVILPDAASSARYESVDRPALQAAFDDAGVESDIQNAGGDVSKFQTIADGMISSGVTVLIIDSLDNDSGAAVIKKATDAGIPVIDYDRLTLGGGASYYVSFDNVAVGTAIGEGLVSCMKANGDTSGKVVELNGASTDNNATLFKQGYDKVIKDAGYDVVASQAVPDWDNTKAGTIFEQIYTQQKGDFVGVAAANDGLGGAVIARLDTSGEAGKIPVTGQDATDEGLQRVLLGTQCVTIFKDIKNKEAVSAANLAVALAKGDTAAADKLATGTTEDTELGKDVKSVLLEPEAITADKVKDVVEAGQTTADKLCTTDELKKACEENGVS
ncbi:substrate-binding domain-containing protein [Kineosporia sp. J2-2]|uniref:Substrate-binding domain-containing protein n=1 Tax=Kineosporia corallincola TaxID=2835133 RepID=A0ABS5THY2_9ACTN|nr:substrate-binding domain-containing protein [Kineosporia corallincola]MBT0769194.1 substrate-binding domain-containing protein [Kineosporia corallincola]